MTGANGKAYFKAGVRAGIGLLLATCGQLAHTADAPGAYVMTVVTDQAQGEQMLSGEYSRAIAAIVESGGASEDAFAMNNNLCVAYTKTNELPKAGQACEQALRVSRTRFAAWYDAFDRRGDHAVALSNRGVIRAINGDHEGARSDFERAVKLNDKLSAPAENLAILERAATAAVSSL